MAASVLEKINAVFGSNYESFKPEQAEMIRLAAEGDVLGVLPTACAPPPGAYDPKLLVKIPTASLTKSDRFKQKDENLPGPGAFTADLNSTTLSTFSTATHKGNNSHSMPWNNTGSFKRKKKEPLGPLPKSISLGANDEELNKELDQCHRRIKEMEAQIEVRETQIDVLRSQLESVGSSSTDLDLDRSHDYQALQQEAADLKLELEEASGTQILEQQRSFETNNEIVVLKKQLTEKQSEGKILDSNMVSILDKYAVLEEFCDMRTSQSEHELDLRRQLLARRESLDRARSHFAEVEESNLSLMQAMDKHVESKNILALEKETIATELEKVVLEKETLQKELDQLKMANSDEWSQDQSVIDHLYGDKVEGEQTIQQLESVLHEKVLLLDDALSRVANLKQLLAEKDCALMRMEFEKSVLDRTLAETNDDVVLKSESIEEMLAEKADLHEEVQSLELLLLEKEQTLHSQDSKLTDLGCQLAYTIEELRRKNLSLGAMKVELEQSELESDERRSQISDFQAQIDILRGDLEEKETRISRMKLHVAQLEFIVEAKTNEFAVSKEDSEREIGRLQREKNAFKEVTHVKLNDFEERVDALVRNGHVLSEKLGTSESRNRDLEVAMRDLRIRSDTATVSAQEEILRVRIDRDNFGKDLESLRHRIKSLSSQNSCLEDYVLSLKKQVSALSDEKLALSQVLRGKDEVMENYVIENNGLMEGLQKMNEQLELAQTTSIQAANQIQELVARANSLEELKSNQYDKILHLNDRISLVERERSEMQSENERLCGDITVLVTEREEALTAVADLEQGQKNCAQMVTSLQSRTQELETAVCQNQESVKKIAEMELKLSELRKEKEQVQNQYSLDIKFKLTEMDQQYTNFKSETECMLAERDELLREQQEQYEQMIISLEEQLSEARQDEDVVQEARRWQTMYEELQAKVRPFQDQLDQYELERRALLNNAKHASHEMEHLGRQYAKLLGHQNQRQKIQHVMKLKEENLNLQKEVSRLTEIESKARRTIRRLEEELAKTKGKKRLDRSLQTIEQEKENPQEKEELPLETPKRKGKKESRPRTPLSARKQAEAPSTPGKRI